MVESMEKSSSEESIEIVSSTEFNEKSNGTPDNVAWKRGSYHLEEYPEFPSWITKYGVLFTYAVMIFFSTIADWLRAKRFFKNRVAQERDEQKDFVSIHNAFESLYVNNIYRIATDVVNRPIAGVAGVMMKIKERETDDYGWTQKYTGKELDVINFGSYNYLGFSHNDGPCANAAAKMLDKQGIHIGGSRQEAGCHRLQRELETCVAKYIGVEDAICFPMGFATNSMNIASLADKDTLILSDELNHASLVLGCRISGASVKVFKHNSPSDCERQIRETFCKPNPKTGKLFRKILIVIEGIYSMEGTIVNLPEFIKVKKQYKAYLFLDEAHSIGALGPSGRGVTEYWNCSPSDVDVMMGTLTKSFAAAGGYMAGKKTTIDHMRVHSAGACYETPMSPPVIAQVLSSMKIMRGDDGTTIGKQKADQLLRNTRYFRQKLKALGFVVFGHDDSPVVPLLTYYLTKVVCFGRLTLPHGIASVSVGFPATPLTKSRVRFCISADHTKEMLDHVLSIADRVGDQTGTKYGTVVKGLNIEY